MPSSPRKPRLTEDQQRRFDSARHALDTGIQTTVNDIQQGTDPARAYGFQLRVAQRQLAEMLSLVVELTDPVADVDRAIAADLDEQTAPDFRPMYNDEALQAIAEDDTIPEDMAEGFAQNIRDGHLMVGRNADGQLVFRITEAGKRAVKSMGQDEQNGGES